jgi:hypothetical protein
MPDLFNAKQFLVERWRNRTGTRIPFTAGQVFGLTIREDMSEVCRLDPSQWPSNKTENGK